MPQYRELYDYTYEVAPNIQVWPNLYPGRNRLALDIFEGYVNVDAGVVAAPTNHQIARVRQSDVFDLDDTGGLNDGVKILMPGYYEIEFEINATGSHSIDITEDGIGLGTLAASPVVAATNRTKLTASINDATATPAAPLIVRFRALTQATANAITASGSRIVIRRIGEIQAL